MKLEWPLLELARKGVLNAPALRIVRRANINTTSKRTDCALRSVNLKEKDSRPAKSVPRTVSLATSSDSAPHVLTIWFSTQIATAAKTLQETPKKYKPLFLQAALRTVSLAKLLSTAVNASQATNLSQQHQNANLLCRASLQLGSLFHQLWLS